MTRSTREPKPRFFATPADFRRWLEEHHQKAAELWVGFHRKRSGKPSITWPESVEQALCFGWIDGVRKSVDATSYKIRFTPRRASSVWSNINVASVARLRERGEMRPAGLRAFEARQEKKTGIYSFEQRETASLDDEMEQRFRRERAAWAFFQAQPPGYRRVAAFWVVSAKKPETRARRLDTLIRDSAEGRRLAVLTSPAKRVK